MADRISIEGIQEAQQANIRAIAAMKAGGAFGKALKQMTVGAHAYAVKITHVDTGALKASHRMEYQESRYRGIVDLDEGAVGPSGAPHEYGPYEHARGGSHAFYERTVNEEGRTIASEGIRAIVRATVYGR